jgi:predicted RNA binding protein YcfA (HicA-like mRNA interferase family)
VNAVRFEELRRLLEAYGWELARIRGSHHVFVRDGAQLTVPHHRPHVLPVYVRQVLALIQEPEADQESDDGADGTD